MRARRTLIASSFFVLLPLILGSCSGGGSDAPQSLTPPPPPPATASLLYRTDATVVRSQTDGSQQVTLARDATRTTFFSPVVQLNESTVVYTTRESIKTVRLDGTNPQFVTAMNGIDHFFDVVGGWILYYQHNPTTGLVLLRSILPDGTQDHSFDGSGSAEYIGQVAGRALFMPIDTALSSVVPSATTSQLLVNPDVPFSGTVSYGLGHLGTQSLYAIQPTPFDNNHYDVWTVDVVTGVSTPLANDPAHEWPAAVVASWVIYHRCESAVLPVVLRFCDVYRVNIDGTGARAFTTHPDNDAVQGVVGQRVVIRRSHGGPTDTLLSIPVTGGEETPILTLSFDNEFFMAIVGDRIILERTTGLWSVKADGSGLVRLTADNNHLSTIYAAGSFACFNSGTALWCVPADGSEPATKVTDNGTFVTGL